MLNIPTLLTLSRVILIIPQIYLLMAGYDAAAFVLFVILTITDFFDGYLARKWNQTSALGAFLDPIADKLLVAAVLIVFVDIGRLTGLWVIAPIVIILREIWVPGIRGFVGYDKPIAAVTKLAKWKTTMQMVAVAALFLAEFHDYIYWLGLGSLAIAAILTFITAIDYTQKAWHYYNQNK